MADDRGDDRRRPARRRRREDAPRTPRPYNPLTNAPAFQRELRQRRPGSVPPGARVFPPGRLNQPPSNAAADDVDNRDADDDHEQDQ